MKYTPLSLILLAACISLTGCLKIPNPYPAIPEGIWRAELDLSGQIQTFTSESVFEERTDGALPFNFEVIYRDDHTFYLDIINGEERIRVDDIKFGLDRSTGKDTILFKLPLYDSYVRAKYEEDAIEGEWINNVIGDYRIPFRAYHGKVFRFTEIDLEPAVNISGIWAAEFEVETEHPYPAVGEFAHKGNHVTGTFMTETGDYRYLEGTVQENRLYLSCFDGAHAFLFEAKILDDGSLSGIFRSGKHYKTYWNAVKDPEAKLTNPDSLTYLKPGYDKFDFYFPNLEGDTISLSDKKYQGKPLLVTIFGTWCPNCRDEAAFLQAFLEKNPEADLEVISIAFERHKDPEDALNALRRYKSYYGIQYEIVYAGYMDKKQASEKLPMLNRVISYPTMLFIDRRGRVQRIYTGFTGPATSAFEDFRKGFEKDIAVLQREPL